MLKSVTTMGELMHRAADRLSQTDTSTPELDALVLLEHASGRDRAWLHAYADAPTSSCGNEALAIYRELLDKRIDGQPVAYLIGEKEFYGLQFEVASEVLIPRPESEAMVKAAIELAPTHTHILDVGCGSGALAVAVAVHRPDCQLQACDNQPQALAVAQRNAERHDVDITFTESDVFSNYSNQRFDIILANLPYLPDGYRSSPETRFEPHDALYAGPDGLEVYQQFFNQLPHHITSEAQVIIEHLPTQTAALRRLAKSVGLQPRKHCSQFVTVFSA